MVMALMQIALAFNFILTTPPFNPLGWAKEIVGVVFLFIGISKIVFLNHIRYLILVRFAMATSFAWTLYWGTGASFTFFDGGRTSLQLPILYWGVSVLEFILMFEPSKNPLAEAIEGTANEPD